MDLHTFCQTFGFDSVFENKLFPVWDRLWEHSDADLPFFMKADFYHRHYPLCHGPENIRERMDRVAEITARTPVCARLASMIHHALFLAEPQINPGEWPPLEKFYGENSGIFYLLCAMSCLPLIEKKHKELKLPGHFWKDAADFIGGRMQIYAAAHHGLPGHTSAFAFLRHHVDGKLFRIGRLEFMMQPAAGFFPAVYINARNGSMKVLCRDGWSYDGNGLFLVNPQEIPAFTAGLSVKDGHVTGTPLSPYGYPQTWRRITLNLAEWRPLCTPWDLVPAIHIPGGGGITLERLKESMQEACRFFRQYFHQDVQAFSCGSWIFNPDWETELPKSNMAAWQRNMYLYAVCKAPKAGLFFVYGREDGDPRNWQRTTSLHEAFCRQFEQNNPLKYGCSFILTRHLKFFGTEYYRAQWETESAGELAFKVEEK